MHLRLTALLILSVFLAPSGNAQSPNSITQGGTSGLFERLPDQYEILGISVEGVESETAKSVVTQASGLRVGQSVTVPGDEALGDAIRSIYRLGLFSDVKIVEERRVGDGVFLAIRVEEEPRLVEYTFSGVKRGHRKDLEEEVPILTGSPVRPSDIERSKQAITSYFKEKGYLLSSVEVARERTPEGHVALDFQIDRGPKVEIDEIRVHGNQEVSESRVKRSMKNTDEDRWWRFWSAATFDRDEYEEDLQNVVQYYNDRGYYDARIVEDTVFVRDGEDPGVVVELRIEEGSRYFIRDIKWEGNTVYSDEFLTQSLGFETGDPFNRSKLEENLFANRNSSDVASLYFNRGYMKFRAEPSISVVEGDSLDIHFDIMEGDVYKFGGITIAGNTKTKEHVVRRELYTVPGQTFSRDAIQESIRRLSQLNYFTQESFAGGPAMDIDEQEKKVDLSYTLEEQGSDQLELSGTWGSFGLVLMLRFTFNNFSAQNLFNAEAWDPLPSGDGQKLSLAVQTNGTYYQNYSLSYTEPWFRGRPTPVGFSLSYSSFGGGGRRSFLSQGFGRGAGSLQTGSARAFYERRLKWPDDKFSMSTALRYQYYSNDSLFATIPQGISQIATVQQSLTRNSLDHPIFPMRGSQASLSLELAPPIGGFVQYHKWRFNSQWHVPIMSKLSVGFSSDFGYVGSLTGDPVNFERFIVGGSPFDTQGFTSYFGRDIIYMRGYPAAAIGPRRGDEPVGGTILNKYTSELKWLAIQTPQLSAAPYVFLDAANTWNGFNSYNPSELFRSGGVGMRLFLPILGMLEIAYGYNFDTFDAISSRHDGGNQWYFQFSLGQGFGN
jgi:outer membrane protein insertion porin family